MKKIKLTKGKHALVDDEDFEALNKWSWQLSTTGYAVRRHHVSGSGENRIRQHIAMHREIIGAPYNKDVDHINHNPLDNRKFNLRLCDTSQNLYNSRLRVNKLTKFKGVSLMPPKRNARYRVRFAKILIGYFFTEDEAAYVYDQISEQLAGEFANHNGFI